MTQTLLKRTKVLSLLPFVGLDFFGGMMICPAAMKSESEKTFWKKKSLFAAGFGFNIFAVHARPTGTIITTKAHLRGK